MLPGFVKTCPTCIGANFPTIVLSTAVSVFSGRVEAVQEQIVFADGQETTLHTYDVVAETTWVGIGRQTSADVSLPSLNPPRRCTPAAAESVQTSIFFVIGPQNANPYFWTCF